MVRRVDAFVEDHAHEEFVRAMVRRLSAEESREVDLHFVTARGGHGRVLSELKTYQRARRTEGLHPDLLVVVVDANCKGHVEARSEIAAVLNPQVFPEHIAATPDPHVERWYLADPASLHNALGASTQLEARKCERDRYKQQLLTALRGAGHPVALGGAEFASEIVQAMDLYRACRNEASLKHLVDELRANLRRMT